MITPSDLFITAPHCGARGQIENSWELECVIFHVGLCPVGVLIRLRYLYPPWVYLNLNVPLLFVTYWLIHFSLFCDF